jgi:hypothetical protein
MEEPLMIALNSKLGRGATLAAASALVVGGLVGFVQSPSYAAAATYTASPNNGAGGTGTTVVSITGSGFKSAAGTSLVQALVAGGATGGVQVSTTCGTNSTTGVVGNASTGATVGVIAVSISSATKMVVTVKDLPLTAVTLVKKDYKICVYANAGSHVLLGSAAFTVNPAPAVTAVGPAAGSAAGGQAIAIDGSDFTAASKVTIGGVAATGVKFIDSTSLTAVTPPGTSATAPVVVTTEGGKSGSATTYAYSKAIVVSPNNGPAAGGTTITITGSGFDSLDFTANATVAFTAAGYTAVNTNLDDCDNITVVSDTELVCDTPALTSKSYTVVVLADKTQISSHANNVAYLTGISSGATFTFAAF